jgi:hypothetical protein
MRHFVLGVLALAFSVATAFGQGPANRAEIEKQIMKMEQAINEAFAKNDAATFKKMVAEDGLGVDPTGDITIPEYVKMMAEVKIEPGWKIDNSRVLWINDNTAVHIYRWTGKGTFRGEPMPSPTHSSTVWTNRGGRWVPVFHQETAAAPGT